MPYYVWCTAVYFGISYGNMAFGMYVGYMHMTHVNSKKLVVYNLGYQRSSHFGSVMIE